MTWRHWVSVAVAAALLQAACAQAADPKRVLLLHSYGSDFEPFSDFSGRFREELARQSPTPLDMYEASLEMARFGEVEQEGPFVDYLVALFGRRHLDLVVTIGAPAAGFGQRYRQRLFPLTPMLLTGLDQRGLHDAALTPNDAAVTFRLDIPGIVDNALRLLPATANVAVVIGNSPLEKFWLAELHRELQPFTSRVIFTWFNTLSFDDMQRRAATLPPNSAILLGLLAVDAAGVPHDRGRALAEIHAVANAPIFGFTDTYLGQGIVGGPLISIRHLSRMAAGVAVRILAGETPGGLKTAPLGPEAPAYDWRELQRWNISESRLPPGSEIRFREPSLWRQYRWHIMAVILVVIAQAALISALLLERRRRQLAELESRRRLLEVAHLNRNAEAGVLSASIAHELNQPLVAILCNTETAEIHLKADPPNLNVVKKILADIRRDDQRASDIIRALHGFLRKAEPEIEDVDLNDVVASVLDMIAPEARARGIELTTNQDHMPLPVRAETVHLQQVVLNLALNGMDAMKECAPGERRMAIRTAVDGDQTAEVSICDSGSGIPDDRLKGIFEPFVTTKQQGMGLGLFIARQIIETHGGRIWAENQPSGGAAFRFSLPLAQARAA